MKSKKEKLNKKQETPFVFTEEAIEKIRLLSEKLQKQELRVQPFVHETLKKLGIMQEQQTIDDFNITYELMAFSNDAVCNERNNIEEGDPIYKTYLSHFRCDSSDMFFTDNWNELSHRDHPLSHIHFCYSMHCLALDSHLSWADIVQIDDVWIDVKVDFQFMFNMEK